MSEGSIGNHISTRNRVIAAGALLTSPLGAFACGAVGNDGEVQVGAESITTSEPATTSTPNVIDQGVLDALTVRTTSFECDYLVETEGSGSDRVVKFDVEATEGVKPSGPRLWSDALRAPYESDKSNKRAMLKETQAALCEDPLFGSTFANELANLKVGETKVVDLNPWLRPFKGDADKINDQANKFMPLLGNDGTPSQETFEKAVDQNHAYQDLAEKLGTILERFKNIGVGTEPTVLSYHLAGDGLMVVDDSLPEVELDPNQFEAAEMLRFNLTTKHGECVLMIGFNVGDMRPELAKVCMVVTPTTKPPVTVTSSPPGRPPMTITVPTTPTTLRPKTDDGSPGLDDDENTPPPNGEPTPDDGSDNPVGTTSTTPDTAPATSSTTTPGSSVPRVTSPITAPTG